MFSKDPSIPEQGTLQRSDQKEQQPKGIEDATQRPQNARKSSSPIPLPSDLVPGKNGTSEKRIRNQINSTSLEK